MNNPARGMWKILAFGVAVAVFATAPAWSQSSDTSGSGGTNWGYYTPPKPAKPQTTGSATQPGEKQAAKQAAKPSGPSHTAMQGGDTSGNRPQVTASSSSSGGAGGAAVQTQKVSVPGINGGSRSIVDQETETKQIGANTTRTITKIYGQDPDGNRELIGVQQTDTTDLGNGKSKSVTRESQLDMNGQMNVTRQVNSETVPSGPHSNTTNVTVFTPGQYGEMTPAQKIQEVEHTGDKTKQTTSTLLTPGANGDWATTQKTETVVHAGGNGQQTKDKKVYSVDGNGNLTVAQQVVTRDWKDKSGQVHQDVNTYVMTPGGTITAQGGGLTLVQRVSTVKTTKPNGTIETRERTEKAPPLSMSEGLKVAGEVVTVATPTQSGALDVHQTVLGVDGNGQLQQISAFSGQEPQPKTPGKADTGKEKKPAAKAAPAPAKQP
ncbi:MAG TPA: hypothetical protein VNJ52_04685 [Patescibacteria group bacterium]|nr:hypothetical protein [Patescibacteria group bacterium]